MSMTKIMTAALLALGLSVPLMAGSATSEALIAKTKKEVKSISSKELKKMIDNEDDVWMLDVRESYMRVEGSIDAMEHVAVGRGVLEFDIEHEIEDKNAFIVVYCRSGKSAVLAAETLVKVMGYKNVQYLEGGIEKWLEEGNSIFNNFGEMKLAE